MFPFNFVLPPDLPSSYEGGTGYVRYHVKAVIDKPWKFDHTTKQAFTVISILDLNTDPNAQVCCLKNCDFNFLSINFRVEFDDGM